MFFGITTHSDTPTVVEKPDFSVAINRLLGNEGGYVNNPADPGGETNWGISKRSYPTVNIKDLTRDGAIALYKRDFWDAIGLDNQPFGIGFQMLDFAVNSGISTAIRALQRSVGCADDGHIGAVTLAAVAAMSPHDFIMKFLAERLVFMTGCKNWSDAGKGWARRIAADLRFGAQDS
jgi:lysozyme family protein